MAAQVITCEGDAAFKSALKQLAKKRKTSIAQIVRDALDAHYGDTLNNLASFFADDGTILYQSVEVVEREPEAVTS